MLVWVLVLVNACRQCGCVVASTLPSPHPCLSSHPVAIASCRSYSAQQGSDTLGTPLQVAGCSVEIRADGSVDGAPENAFKVCVKGRDLLLHEESAARLLEWVNAINEVPVVVVVSWWCACVCGRGGERARVYVCLCVMNVFSGVRNTHVLWCGRVCGRAKTYAHVDHLTCTI